MIFEFKNYWLGGYTYDGLAVSFTYYGFHDKVIGISLHLKKIH